MSVKDTFIMLIIIYVSVKLLRFIRPIITSYISRNTKSHIHHHHYLHNTPTTPPTPPQQPRIINAPPPETPAPELTPPQREQHAPIYGTTQPGTAPAPYSDIDYLNELYYRD